MQVAQSLYINSLNSNTQELLIKGGFDIYQHAFSAQEIKDDRYTNGRHRKTTPIQFLILNYKV